MFSYQTQGTKTFLIYQLEPQDRLDSVSLGMLSNNEIPGISVASFYQIDQQQYIRYDVTGKITAKDYLDREIPRKHILAYLDSMVSALLSASDYMLDIGTLLLDPDKIFVMVSNGDTSLICLPLIQDQYANVDFHQYFRNLIYSIRFRSDENSNYIAVLMNFLNQPTFSLDEFRSVVHELRDETSNPHAGGSFIQPQPVSPQPRPAEAQPQPQFQPQFQAQQRPAASQPAPQPRPAAPQPQPRPAAVQPQAVSPQPRPAQPSPKADMAIPSPRAGGSAMSGFEIPGQEQAPIPAPAPAPAPASKSKKKSAPQVRPEDLPGGKRMTFFNLMMHYSSENAAIYKAQKEYLKQLEASNPEPAPQPAPAPEKKGRKASKKDAAPDAGAFAIPGQDPGPVQPAGPQSPVQPPYQPKPSGPKPSIPQTSQINQPAAAFYQPPVHPAPQPSAPVPPVQQYSMDFGETMIMGGTLGGETMIIGAENGAAMLMPYLIRLKNNETIPVKPPKFKIGKDPNFSDYCISDNPAVSRSHAYITVENGRYMIIDTNSKNHTYVDGQMIPVNTPVEVMNGAKIKLGNEEFEFRMM